MTTPAVLRLPMRVHPLPDEVTSSFIVRLAMQFGVKLQTFSRALWPDEVLWHLDIDRFPPSFLLHSLAAATSLPIATIEATSLRSFAEHLSDNCAPGATPWILPLAKYRFVRRGFGQQFCPLCLADNCCLRRIWRLAFLTVCPLHGCELLDRCPQCKTPFHFHRGDMGDRNRATGSPAICFQCGQDLRCATAIPLRSRSQVGLTSFQRDLTAGATTGWMMSPNGNVVYSRLYFRVLRQLVKLLTQKSAAARLRIAVTEAISVESYQTASGQQFERMTPAQRGVLLQMASWLLGDWPVRFLDLCRSNRVYSSVLLRDFESPPFWFWRVVNEHLYVVHSPWRSGGAKEPHSYSQLGRMRVAPTPRTLAQRRRIDFVCRRPRLWKDHTSMAKALVAANLYSKKVHYSQVLKACPRLVVAAQTQRCRRGV